MTSATTPIIQVTQSPKRAQKMHNSQSVTHLLNFTLPPRQSQPLHGLPRRSRKSGAQHQLWNKERFVNAQYRFVMDPTGDYTVHFADPDIFFEWQDILQVIIPRSTAQAVASDRQDQSSQVEGQTICPICLAPPTAPRMTKCGHVYCFPCILHYLNTSDNKWARCPICFDSISEKQLKSVKWFDERQLIPAAEEQPISSSSSAVTDTTVTPQAGSTMHFRLMQRPQITTLALPRSPTWPSDLVSPHQAPFHFLPDIFEYAKFMLATPAYLIEDLTIDLQDLGLERRSLIGMNDHLGVTFVDAAEHKVRNQIVKASALQTPLLESQIEKTRKDLKEMLDLASRDRVKVQKIESAIPPALEDVPEEFLRLKTISPNLPSQETITTHQQSRPSTRNAHRQRKNVNPPPPSTSTYYFYQAASGLPIFLHPLDIKILLSHFTSYASFPDTIAVRVEASNEGSVNDDLRKRCKYLAHFPDGADVVFIESDLEGVVGPTGLKNFEQALKMRTVRRKEKGKREDRAKARAEEKEKERRQLESISSWSTAVAVPTLTVESEDEFLPLPSREGTAPLSSAARPTPAGGRSFASALSSPPQNRTNNTPRDHEPEDEWDFDAAWHDLEQRNGGSGRRKKSNKLILLGGSGRRR